MLISNKEINKIKLALTTQCNLACPYCFVEKRGQEMSFPVAQKAVRLLINSPGKRKLLSLYGGEPFLKYELLKNIIIYAQKLAKWKNKNLIINVCSNGILLREEHLKFLRNHQVRLILSLVGQPPVHNRFRRFKNGSGTYELLRKKIPLIFKVLKKENVGASFCVFPFTLRVLENNFWHLIDLEFDYINFEIIREYQKWSPPKIKEFKFRLHKILDSVIESIEVGKYIFINPISWELEHQTLTKNLLGYNCLFLRDLEVYPAGEIAFSPFVLNCAKRANYIIGNLAKNKFKKKYAECSFSWNSLCRICRRDYFEHYRSDKGADKVSKILRALCWQTAQLIKKRAQKEIAFKHYLQEVTRHKCF